MPLSSFNMEKPYDFAKRSILFGRQCRIFINKIPRSIGVEDDERQLIRSSGSIGANYVEAQEGLSKKDSTKYLKISRKEAKECTHWLAIFTVHITNSFLEEERETLCCEAQELVRILTSMIKKLEK